MSKYWKRAPLEVRRQVELERRRADALLREARQADRSPQAQIECAFRRESSRGRVYRAVAGMLEMGDDAHRAALRDLLLRVCDVGAAETLIERHEHARGLTRLASLRPRWIRPLADWRPRTHNAARQFSSLARHLLARYPVPVLFDQALFARATEAEWFIHVGSGQNLRTAPGLPFPLTKMMAHHALLAPAEHVGCVVEALRWGQVRGLGGSARLAAAVVASRLRTQQFGESFWLTVVQFLVNHGPMLDPQQVAPLIDFVHAQRFERGPARVENGVVVAGTIPQPNLSMKGRSVESLLRQMHGWHRMLARETKAGRVVEAWPASGIAGYERAEGTPGNERLFRVVELLDVRQLVQEGRAMRHCVASYASSCASGRCAIFSMREDSGAFSQAERRLTIEVIIQNRRIVQARGRFNAAPDGVAERVLRAWAATAGLTIAPLGRW
jgi:hypothetical protein